MATLINGNLNDPVYAAQDADLIAAICGNKTCITPVGGKFEATLEDANTIMVEDGVIITQEGRRIQLDVGDIDEFIIPTGSQGITQYYIVGYRLYTDSESAELCENFVEPVDSASETINEGTFRGGETEVYVSLLRVKQEGVNITDIEVLLPYSTDITQLNNDFLPKSKIALMEFTGQTDSYGRLFVDYSVLNKYVLSALSSENGEVASWVRLSGDKLCFQLQVSSTHAYAANVTRTVTCIIYSTT